MSTDIFSLTNGKLSITKIVIEMVILSKKPKNQKIV